MAIQINHQRRLNVIVRWGEERKEKLGKPINVDQWKQNQTLEMRNNQGYGSASEDAKIFQVISILVLKTENLLSENAEHSMSEWMAIEDIENACIVHVFCMLHISFQIISTKTENTLGAYKITQHLPQKPDNLNSISGTHIKVEGPHRNCPLTSIQALWHAIPPPQHSNKN